MAQPPDRAAWNAWINFAMLAVAGRMQEADTIMRGLGGGVRRVAVYLQAARPPTLRPLWRGLLLEPKDVLPGGYVEHDPQFTFLSWTEDRDVACFFGDPGTTISGDVAAQKPTARGYLAHDPAPTLRRVLFHHTWRVFPLPGRGPTDLAQIAVAHPQLVGLGPQIEHYLATQSEVIVDAPPAGTRWKLEDPAGCPPRRELDVRFTPPEFHYMIKPNPEIGVLDDPAAYAATLSALLRPNDRVALATKEIRRVERTFQVLGMKPNGLWYQCGNEWVEWLQSEQPSWMAGYKYAYRVVPSKRVLKLTTAKQVLAFSKKYGALPDGSSLNWMAVARDWAGIEICPYQYVLRFPLIWYYGWDVASGCIWDPSGLAAPLELIATQQDGVWSLGAPMEAQERAPRVPRKENPHRSPEKERLLSRIYREGTARVLDFGEKNTARALEREGLVEIERTTESYAGARVWLVSRSPTAAA